jgi:tRNA threonylcarbamoyladenosine biosynthesis protein TsaB
VIILALDTTTRAGSAAVVRDGAVLAELSGDPAITHGQRLPGELMRVLAQAGVRIEDVDLFAVAAGPGSFTGLRVGISTVQGLAMARSRRVVAVSTLDALAWVAANATGAAANATGPAANADRRIAAWMDAQRGDVSAALYTPDGRDTLIAPQSSAPAVVLDRWIAAADITTAVFIGDGAVRYRETVESRLGAGVLVTPPPPLARAIGAIAAADPGRAVLPHAVVPIYVRVSDAELARARRLP